jgi:predicted DCC family thiol-disulfide oxidoreductase YuxK
MVVVDGARKLVRGDGVTHVLRQLPGWAAAAAFLGAPGIRNVTNWGYDLFARNRHRVSARLGMRACALTPRGAPRKDESTRG